MEITGKLIEALPVKSGVSQRTGNTWMSREYVLETEGQYPKKFVFTVFGEDRLKQFALRKDERVLVYFDIDAHEYNGRWFNEIRAFNVVRVNEQPQAQAPQQAAAPAPTEQSAGTQPAPAVQTPQQQPLFGAPESAGGGSADDLPFDLRGVAA